MKRIFIYMYIAALAAVALCGCGGGEQFTIDLQVDSLGQQAVTMTYVADGAVNTVELQPSDKGEFKFVGESGQPALVEFTLTSSGAPLAMLLAQNGDRIKCRLTLGDELSTLSVKGSRQSEMLAQFMADNAPAIAGRDSKALNDSIKAFITAHPADVASTALLVTRFSLSGNEALADSLLNVISVEARPATLIESFNSTLNHRVAEAQKEYIRAMRFKGREDSIYSYVPQRQSYTLLAFTGREQRVDSVTAQLDSLAREWKDSRLLVLEVSLVPDSSAWRRTVKADSARWVQTWTAGSAASIPLQRLKVPDTPYFIVADSAGRQLLRTRSITAAAEKARKKAAY